MPTQKSSLWQSFSFLMSLNVCEIKHKCYHCKIKSSTNFLKSQQHKCISVAERGRLQCCAANWHACGFLFWLGIVLSCIVAFMFVMRTGRHTLSFGASTSPNREYTTSAVTSVGCEQVLGSSQTSNIWLVKLSLEIFTFLSEISWNFVYAVLSLLLSSWRNS